MTTSRRELRQARRAARVQADALRQDLAAFASPAELLELSAMLARYDDHQTEGIRALVVLTPAA
jgi:hypothetical protein